MCAFLHNIKELYSIVICLHERAQEEGGGGGEVVAKFLTTGRQTKTFNRKKDTKVNNKVRGWMETVRKIKKNPCKIALNPFMTKQL